MAQRHHTVADFGNAARFLKERHAQVFASEMLGSSLSSDLPVKILMIFLQKSPMILSLILKSTDQGEEGGNDQKDRNTSCPALILAVACTV